MEDEEKDSEQMERTNEGREFKQEMGKEFEKSDIPEIKREKGNIKLLMLLSK